MQESGNPVKYATLWWRIASTVIFLGAAAGVSLHCYRHSMFSIDLLGYTGLVAFADTGDVVKAHEIVYAGPLTPHLRGLDDNSKQALDMRHRAADPYYAAIHFPYFAIKPLYVLTLETVHKAGVMVLDAPRTVSSLFFFGIAVMLWLYTRSWLAIIIMIRPEIMLLGQTEDPDGMSCFLLLLGLWMVYVRRKDIGMLPLLLAIWVRPESALLCVLVVVALLIEGRLEWKGAAILGLLSIGSDLAINHYGYPWRELYAHLLGAAPGTSGALAFANYGQSIIRGIKETLHGPMSLYGLLWLVCFPLVSKPLRWILGITLVFTIARFVMFPLYEPRYNALFFLTAAIAGITLAKDMIRVIIERSYRNAVPAG